VKAAEEPKKPAAVLRCSFCNKSQRDVKKLIAGPTVYICDECVDICLDIIAKDLPLAGHAESGVSVKAGPPTECSLCGDRTVPLEMPAGTVICTSCLLRMHRRLRPVP
jgi:hypothetical protein